MLSDRGPDQLNHGHLCSFSPSIPVEISMQTEWKICSGVFSDSNIRPFVQKAYFLINLGIVASIPTTVASILVFFLMFCTGAFNFTFIVSSQFLLSRYIMGKGSVVQNPVHSVLRNNGF